MMLENRPGYHDTAIQAGAGLNRSVPLRHVSKLVHYPLSVQAVNLIVTILTFKGRSHIRGILEVSGDFVSGIHVIMCITGVTIQ